MNGQLMQRNPDHRATRLFRTVVVVCLAAFATTPIFSKQAPPPTLRQAQTRPGTIQPRRIPAASATLALENLQNQSPQRWDVRWSDVSGLPRTLVAGQSRPYAGRARQVAASF